MLWVEAAGQAHGDALVGLLFAGWLLAARRGGVVLASALLGAAVASKLTAALPAGMYIAYLAGRPGPWAARLGRTAAAALGLVVVLAYWPFLGAASTRCGCRSPSWRSGGRPTAPGRSPSWR